MGLKSFGRQASHDYIISQWAVSIVASEQFHFWLSFTFLKQNTYTRKKDNPDIKNIKLKAGIKSVGSIVNYSNSLKEQWVPMMNLEENGWRTCKSRSLYLQTCILFKSTSLVCLACWISLQAFNLKILYMFKFQTISITEFFPPYLGQIYISTVHKIHSRVFLHVFHTDLLRTILIITYR